MSIEAVGSLEGEELGPNDTDSCDEGTLGGRKVEANIHEQRLYSRLIHSSNQSMEEAKQLNDKKRKFSEINLANRVKHLHEDQANARIKLFDGSAVRVAKSTTVQPMACGFEVGCRHNGEDGVSAWDVAEHVGNAEFGSVARDLNDAGVFEAIGDALEVIGNEITKND